MYLRNTVPTPKIQEKMLYLSLLGTLGGLSTITVQAADTQWIGTNSDNFLDASNWNNGSPVGNNSFINLVGSGKYLPVMNGGTLNVGLLHIGVSPYSPGVLRIQNGAVVNYADLDMGHVASPPQAQAIETQALRGESVLLVQGSGTILRSTGTANTNIGYDYDARIRISDQARMELARI